jgi:hypothetical protein
MKDSKKANEILDGIGKLTKELKKERKRMEAKYCNNCDCNMCRNKDRHCDTYRGCFEGNEQRKHKEHSGASFKVSCNEFVFGG